MGARFQESPSPELAFQTLTGVVLAVQANYYQVQLDRPAAVPGGDGEAIMLLCTRRTRLKKIGQQVMVGDRVQIEEPDWAGGRGAIAQVFPRRTQLDRPPMANADQIVLVFAIADPPLEPFQLSRFLIKAELTRLSVCLCLNKRDLVPAAEQEAWCDRLQSWGYPPMLISVQQQAGLAALRDRLEGRISVVSGPSGVGKSSLINLLIPEVDLRVGTVSGKLRHGRHTTRHVELFELPSGGLLADSPGFNQPDLNCSPLELAQSFPEIRQRLQQATCQFNDCLHQDEPGCAVRGDWERYEYYRVFLEEAIARQEALNRQSDAEPTTKQKVRSDGQLQTEPLLEARKYRRPSRRSEKQALRDLYQDLDRLPNDDL